MQRHLYFICPSDHLEPIIDRVSNEECFFITSLGNSIQFTPEKMSEINALIETENIRHISFVLAYDNSVLTDALEHKIESSQQRLAAIYRTLSSEKKEAEAVWQTNGNHIPFHIKHLNKKKKELFLLLPPWLLDRIHIHVQLYHRQTATFQKDLSTEIYHQYFSIN